MRVWTVLSKRFLSVFRCKAFLGIPYSRANVVPRICWPFDADQPLLAAQLSETHKVAYELLEVRTEPWGLKPLYRTGKAPTGTLDAVREEARVMLDKAFGEDGMTKRENMKPLQKAILDAWKENGSARKDVERFLASFEHWSLCECVYGCRLLMNSIVLYISSFSKWRFWTWHNPKYRESRQCFPRR